jgi:hypothetical protein
LRKYSITFPANIAKNYIHIGVDMWSFLSVEGVFHIVREKMGINVKEIKKLNFRRRMAGSLVVYERWQEFYTPKRV